MRFISSQEIAYQNVILSNSPWMKGLNLLKPEPFRREAFYRVEKHLHAKHEMAVLIKGPRRVGKTEIQKQLIWELLNAHKIDPNRVLYLSFDDVQIQSEKPEKRARFVQGILNEWAQRLGFETYDEIEGTAYCFFDEVQAVEDWAHLIKNRIERNPKVRIVLSGSAAHSIFEKALKILLGRVISEKINTFSFREFLMKNGLIEEDFYQKLFDLQRRFEADFSAPHLTHALYDLVSQYECDGLEMREYISRFLREGGFPQLWKLDEENVIEQAHFIDENYVKKVTLEDLMLLQQIKKPELYERLLRHLFARPGQEYNQNKVASELGTTTITLAEAMRLLEQTDLLIFVEKFSKKAEPLKKRNVKIYPVDLMLTFAMTKVVPSLENLEDKGLIAEALVAQTLYRLRGISNLAYLQSDAFNASGEVDFYLRSDLKDFPIEVKYQNQIRSEDIHFMKEVMIKNKISNGLLIVPEGWDNTQGIYSLPLWAFILLA